MNDSSSLAESTMLLGSSYMATGNWDEDNNKLPPRPQGLFKVARNIFVAISIGAETARFEPDHWIDFNRKPVYSSNIGSQIVWQVISFLQAREIALGILRRADDERIRIAEEEATRMSEWEDIF